MKHISYKVVEYVLHVYVCAVFKSVCKTNMDPSWLDLTTIRWLTYTVDHCTITVPCQVYATRRTIKHLIYDYCPYI